MPKTAVPKIGLRATAGKRTLAFGLVRVGVGMGPALDTSSRVSSNYICPEHKERVAQQWECPHGHTVKPERAYPHGDRYVILEDGEVPKPDGNDVIELVANVEAADVHPEYVEKTYLIWPQDATQDEAYALVLGYLRDCGRAFIGTTIDHGTTKAFAVRYSKVFGCLVAQVLNYHANVRWNNVETVRDAVLNMPEPADEMKKMAGTIFDSLPDEFAWEDVRDEYGERLAEAIAEKAATGAVAPVEDDAPQVSADTLMEALKASVAAAQAEKPKARKRKKAAA